MTTLTSETIPQHFEQYVKAVFGNNATAARHFTVSHQFIRAVITGRSPPTKPMLKAMGYKKRKVVIYEPIEKPLKIQVP